MAPYTGVDKLLEEGLGVVGLEEEHRTPGLEDANICYDVLLAVGEEDAHGLLFVEAWSTIFGFELPGDSHPRSITILELKRQIARHPRKNYCVC